MATLKIKKGDTVKVIAGKDKDKEGKVVKVDHENGRVVVEGILVFEDFVAPQASFHVGQVLGDFQRQAGVFGEIPDGDLVAAIERLQCEEGVSGDEQERQDDQRVTIGDQVNERAGVASHERFR